MIPRRTLLVAGPLALAACGKAGKKLISGKRTRRGHSVSFT